MKDPTKNVLCMGTEAIVVFKQSSELLVRLKKENNGNDIDETYFGVQL